MSAAKMKTTSSATAVSTDVQERIRKHQQQQQYQQQRPQDNKPGNSVAGTATADPPPATSTSTPAVQVPTKTIPTTAVETTATTLQGAVGGRGGGRRNRTKKMRSASGDDFKRSTIDKRKASAAKEKRHVNFISTNSKSTAGAGGSSKLMKKSASGLRAQNTDLTTSDPNGLPSISKSKSILKVKHVVVLKRKAGTGKVSKKLKKAPQGAQAESEAAELSKLAQQFTRTLPESGAAEDTQLLPARSASQEDGGKNKRRLLKRRHSAVTKHAPSGAGIVESGSVNVPPVRRFSPVTDKSALSDGRDVKVYGEGNFDAMKTLDLPTTSRNITVAMVKEQHNKEEKESNAEQQQEEQVPNQTSNSNENTNTANTANISPVELAHVRSRRAGSLTSAAPAASGGGGSVSATAVANAIPGLVDAQIVMPIDDPNASAAAGAITSNNSHSSKEGKVNEESAAKTSTEAAAVAGPSTSSQTAEDDKDKEEDKDAKKKKNRCAECRKKVGLTGFQCRCGGLYCAVHRYSDKHDCTFNYREHGAQEIRRNNPVVVGEKIQKI